MRNRKSQLFKLFIAILIVIGAIVLYRLFADRLTLNDLHSHQNQLKTWLNEHYIFGLLVFLCTYIILVAVSLPGASLGSIAAGFLFGTWIGSLCIIVGATIGALIVFLLVRYFLRDWVSQRLTKRMQLFNEHVSDNALHYLLFLRLVPLFPFWLVNIAPAILKVRVSHFFWSTFLGIIPGSIVYVSIGSGLEHISTQQQLNLKIIFTPSVFLPLLGLGILSLIPIIVKHLQGKRHDSDD